MILTLSTRWWACEPGPTSMSLDLLQSNSSLARRGLPSTRRICRGTPWWWGSPRVRWLCVRRRETDECELVDGGDLRRRSATLKSQNGYNRQTLSYTTSFPLTPTLKHTHFIAPQSVFTQFFSRKHSVRISLAIPLFAQICATSYDYVLCGACPIFLF